MRTSARLRSHFSLIFARFDHFFVLRGLVPSLICCLHFAEGYIFGHLQYLPVTDNHRHAHVNIAKKLRVPGGTTLTKECFHCCFSRIVLWKASEDPTCVFAQLIFRPPTSEYLEITSLRKFFMHPWFRPHFADWGLLSPFLRSRIPSGKGYAFHPNLPDANTCSQTLYSSLLPYFANGFLHILQIGVCPPYPPLASFGQNGYASPARKYMFAKLIFASSFIFCEGGGPANPPNPLRFSS